MDRVEFRTLAVTPRLQKELYKSSISISFVKSLLLQLFFCTYAQELLVLVTDRNLDPVTSLMQYISLVLQKSCGLSRDTRRLCKPTIDSAGAAWPSHITSPPLEKVPQIFLENFFLKVQDDFRTDRKPHLFTGLFSQETQVYHSKKLK
jgi:hypothetical protein